MRIFIKKLIMLLCICEITVACTPTMTRNLWNGVYSQQATEKEYKRKRDELYAKESLEQKKLRQKNQILCENMAKEKYPNETIWENQNGLKRGMLYDDCMKERGSPVY